MSSRWDRCGWGHVYDGKAWHSDGYFYRTCSICRAASRRSYRRRIGITERRDPTRSVDYVRALMWLGWPAAQLAERMGLQPNTVKRLSAAEPAWVSEGTEQAVAKVFAELCMEFGPSVRTRLRAQAKGWLPPLALDDEDDS